MIDLAKMRQIYNYVIAIRDDPNEDPTVRAKAQELISLFDAPSLSAMQNMFQNGTTAQKLGALGSLQSAILRGILET